MSFIKARGEEAAQKAAQDKQNYEKLLKSFKSGSTYRVRIAGLTDYVQYDAHGFFSKSGYSIRTTPCVHGTDCPYCKAVKSLWDEFNNSEDETVKQMASGLSGKERYLIGFVDLVDGTPMILDFTKKQANQIIQQIKKLGKKIEKYPFEISKTGSGQSTIISLDIVLDPEEDLQPEEFKNFEASKDFAFKPEMFEVLQVKEIPEGIEDLQKWGFDTKRITEKPVVEENKNPHEISENETFGEF